MDFLKQQLERMRGEMRGLLGKLSLSQKVSIGLIALVVALLLLLIVQPGGGDDLVTLTRSTGSTDATDIAELQALLEQNGIAHELEGSEPGGVEVRVPRGQIAKARWLALEQGAFGGSEGSMDWLFGDRKIGDTRRSFDAKLLESRKRIAQDTIAASEKIAAATILIERGEEMIFAGSTNRNHTASVYLRLKSGVESLSPKEAATIRNFVRGAFNLLPQNIEISDSNLRHYPYVGSDAAMALSQEQHRLKRDVTATLFDLYTGMFSPAEFRLGVTVDVSQQRSTVARETYDPDAVASGEVSSTVNKEIGVRDDGDAPGAAINSAATTAPRYSIPAVRETRETTETQNEVRFSRVSEKTEVPAGEIKGMSINLVLDRAALVRKLREDGAFVESEPADEAQKPAWRQRLQSAVDAAIERHTEIVKAQVPASLTNVGVKVSTVSFPRREAPEKVAFAYSFSGWFSRNWKDVALVGIILVGLALFVAILRRSVPAPLEIPSLEDQVLLDEDRIHREEIDRLHARIESFSSEEDEIAQELSKNELEDTLARINSTATERPESVAAVLRTWLSGADGEEEER